MAVDLIIDGNAFINVAISVTKSICSKDRMIGDEFFISDIGGNKNILKEGARLSFRNFCLNYFASTIAPISSSIHSVHFVMDSKSWRTKFVTDFLMVQSDGKKVESEFTYKGTRTYKEQNHLFFDYFQESLLPVFKEKCKVDFYRIDGAEGDDIIAKLCEIIDRDIVIYSVDADMKQLVSSGSKNIVLIMPKQMQKHKRVFTPASYFEPTIASDPDDFFSLSDDIVSQTSIRNIVSSLEMKDYVPYVVDPIETIFSKVLLGDKSDNIAKLPKMSPAKAEKTIAKIRELHPDPIPLLDSLDETFLSSLVQIIGEVAKFKSQSELDDLREYLVFNIRVMRLSTKMFPEEVRTSLNERIDTYVASKFSVKDFYAMKNNKVYL